MTGKMGFTPIIINRNCIISFYSFWDGWFRGLGVEKFRGLEAWTVLYSMFDVQSRELSFRG